VSLAVLFAAPFFQTKRPCPPSGEQGLFKSKLLHCYRRNPVVPRMSALLPHRQLPQIGNIAADLISRTRKVPVVID